MDVEYLKNLPVGSILEQIYPGYPSGAGSIIHYFYEKISQEDHIALRCIESGSENESMWGEPDMVVKCDIFRNGEWINHGVKQDQNI
jgi:hypothetical protein